MQRPSFCVDFAPDIAPEGRLHTAERIGLQPDVFATVDDDVSPTMVTTMCRHPRRFDNRYETFLKATDKGYALRRDLAFRDNFKKALDTGQSAPVPAFFWPMLRDLTIPGVADRGQRLGHVRCPDPR